MTKKVLEEGIFKDDLLVQGRKYWEKSQASYVGTFRDGKMHGRGCLTWEDGTTLCGVFNRGYIATGIKEFGPEHSYQGEWEGNDLIESEPAGGETTNLQGQLAHGLGIKHFANGDCYVGHFCKNARQGSRGRYTWADSGVVYDGAWENSLEHGFGEFRYPDGLVYKGYYELGKRHGKGNLSRPGQQQQQENNHQQQQIDVEINEPIVRQIYHAGTLQEEHVVTMSNLHRSHGPLPLNVNSVESFANFFLFGKEQEPALEQRAADPPQVAGTDKITQSRRRSSSTVREEPEPWTTGSEGDMTRFLQPHDSQHHVRLLAAIENRNSKD